MRDRLPEPAIDKRSYAMVTFELSMSHRVRVARARVCYVTYEVYAGGRTI